MGEKIKFFLPVIFIILFAFHHILSYYPLSSFQIFNTEFQRILDKNKVVLYVDEINKNGNWWYISSIGGRGYKGFPFLAKYDILPANLKWEMGVYIVYLKKEKKLIDSDIFRIPFPELRDKKKIFNVIKNNLPDLCYFIISVYGNLDSYKIENLLKNLEYANINLNNTLKDSVSLIILNKKINDSVIKVKEYISKDKVILLKVKI